MNGTVRRNNFGNSSIKHHIILIFVFISHDILINSFSLGFEISGFAMIEKVGS